MARGDQVKSTRVNPDWTKARKVTAPISLEDLMEKEVHASYEPIAIPPLFDILTFLVRLQPPEEIFFLLGTPQ